MMTGKELNKLTRRLYNIDYPEWERLFVKHGGDEDMAKHLWNKWKAEQHDNFLWAFGNFDARNQAIVAKMLR